MNRLKVAITSGGTREYIDDVRVMTNISSGALGAQIGAKFIDGGHDLFYVAPKLSVMPNKDTYHHIVTHDTASVLGAMQNLVPKMDIVIQCMAISDFTFDLEKEIKIDSSDLDGFIEHMRQTITKTPKVISFYRKWNPSAILVGFKFTVGKSEDELTQIAKSLMERNELDMVFANDKAQMKAEGEHVGYLLTVGKKQPLSSKEVIASRIYENAIELASR